MSAAAPVLVKVSVCVAEVFPTRIFPKAKLAGLSETAGPGAA